jgi:hypothetical protein
MRNHPDGYDAVPVHIRVPVTALPAEPEKSDLQNSEPPEK